MIVRLINRTYKNRNQIYAFSTPSYYQELTQLTVETDTKANMKKVLKFLIDYRMADSVEESLYYVYNIDNNERAFR
ncbi:MAG: hypothetical protein AABW67_02505 [Nanoarchaeota archaeon]